MSVNAGVIKALTCDRRVRIQMPECDGPKEGRELVDRIQEQCPFILAYVLKVGEESEVIIWRFRSTERNMEGYQVSGYAC